MSKTISCGVLIRSAGKFLICHATGDKQPDLFDLRWGIPKGRQESNESRRVCAIRELFEETNLDLRAYPTIHVSAKPIHTVSFKTKTVYVFFADDPKGTLQMLPLWCHTRKAGIPEIDAYYWADAETAIEMVTYSQKNLFIQLKNNQIQL